MHPTAEKRLVLLFYVLTEVVLYALALRVASLSVLDTLGGLDWNALQRDRFLVIALYAATALLTGAFDIHRLTGRFDALYALLGALAVALLLQLALATLLPAGWRVLSRREMVAGAGVALLLLGGWRFLATGFLSRFASIHRRFHVLGDPEEGRRIAAAINSDTQLHAEASHCTLDALRAHCAERGSAGPCAPVPEEVIIENPAEGAGGLSEMLTFCEEHFERIYLYPTFDDLLLCKHDTLDAIAGVPLIDVTRVRHGAPYLQMKRGIDIAAAFAGLLLAAPLSIAAAVLVKTTSPGPIFYTQERLGRDGRPFRIFKFRSMRTENAVRDDAGHVLAEEDDPRFTPVGRFLRKHRIDEIPQLFNVLRGDMSLVGPRPVWREYYGAHEDALPLLHLRLLVRPGVTGLAHVLGHYASDPRDRLRYDLVYINSLSLATDLKVLFATIRIVLSGKGGR